MLSFFLYRVLFFLGFFWTFFRRFQSPRNRLKMCLRENCWSSSFSWWSRNCRIRRQKCRRRNCWPSSFWLCWSPRNRRWMCPRGSCSSSSSFWPYRSPQTRWRRCLSGSRHRPSSYAYGPEFVYARGCVYGPECVCAGYTFETACCLQMCGVSIVITLTWGQSPNGFHCAAAKCVWKIHSYQPRPHHPWLLFETIMEKHALTLVKVQFVEKRGLDRKKTLS